MCAIVELLSSARLSLECSRGIRLWTLLLDSSDVVDELEKWQELSPNTDKELLIHSDIFLFCDSPTVVSVAPLVSAWLEEGGEVDCIETADILFLIIMTGYEDNEFMIDVAYFCDNCGMFDNSYIGYCYDTDKGKTIINASLHIPLFATPQSNRSIARSTILYLFIFNFKTWKYA